MHQQCDRMQGEKASSPSLPRKVRRLPRDLFVLECGYRRLGTHGIKRDFASPPPSPSGTETLSKMRVPSTLYSWSSSRDSCIVRPPDASLQPLPPEPRTFSP